MNQKIFLVVGVGRSGTSLAVQALTALGAAVAEQSVPPSEANKLGPMEDIAIRDMFVDLGQKLEMGSCGLRPADWEERPETARFLETLTAHMRAQMKAAGDRHLAVKFPAASMFLPLWRKCFEQLRVESELIWATRQAQSNIGSLVSTYNQSLAVAEKIYVVRNYYIARDLYKPALMLPYERWHDMPERAIGELSKLIGLERTPASLSTVFHKDLDHSPTLEGIELSPFVEDIDHLLGSDIRFVEPGGPIAEITERVERALSEYRFIYAATIPATRPKAARARHQVEAGATRQEEIISRKELEKQRKALEMERQAFRAEQNTLRERLRELEKRRDELELKLTSVTASEAALAEEVERVHRTVRRAAFSKQEVSINSVAISPRTEVERLKSSIRYRIGEAVVSAAKRPDWRLPFLPFRIWKIARRTQQNRVKS